MSIQELPVQELPIQQTPVQEPHRVPGADSPGEAARADARDAEGLSVWPRSARPEPHGDVSVGGVSLAEAADRFGTPVYVLDEQEVRERCRAYRTAFPDADIVYAAKAFLCRAMAHWVQEEGLGLDVCSAGELALAVTAGFPPEKIVMHGNAKSPEDLRTALRLGVGRIVVDSTSEIARLAAITPAGTRQPVMVRVVPGIAAGGHAKVRTGTDDQKFGLSLTDGSAQHAVTRILDQPHLELVGLHCHIGSQVTTVKPYVAAVRRMVGLMARVRDQHDIALPQLNIGGGHAIAYRPGEEHLNISVLAGRVRAELEDGCARAGLPVPRLTLEPGRAIVGPAGVAVYRVLAVKRTGAHTFVAVDGGMSDNPRPALYGVRYAPRLIGRPSCAPPRLVTVVGRHCEAGDVLADEVALPGDVRPGDLLAVPAAGAYHLSMASGYNLVGRPPVVAVSHGIARVLVRRESLDDMSRRDVGL
ncbi:diaminopimelate decarboxylase [Streptomyces sp. NBC_01340]|uniref:diaminopimelate decarboxylase n=1 Tax=unclassified Streptomyces TaxID=2593676 RepID=UPI0022564EB4|nr:MULTISPECIES: diaminopimelate decarboxylase [unclassified Streptomyces]MCX4455969.1 diaminopimelate decarboxylase [Streptomyces sp. NBC_01719]MCX4495328.1 diaminopimelate decarboxylase [Streptomyces sp. NBC_01728]WSI40292.1 diaminopimelate decarboxylase [Streptomyces sp. NBC_01340]